MARGKHPPRAADWRIWMLPCGPGPRVVPDLLSCGALSEQPDWDLGSITREECPSPTRSGEFVVYDEIQGERGNAKLGILSRYAADLAELLAFARKNIRADVHLLLGCSPDSYVGWTKILALTYARPTKWSADKITALKSGDNASSNEMLSLEGVEFYEIVRLAFSGSLAAALVVREVVGIDICQTSDCEDYECAEECQEIVAVQLGDGDTALPSVVYSSDGGTTWAAEDVTTMAATDAPSDIRCMGGSVVVLDNTGNSYHYTDLALLLAGSPVWAEQGSGFVALKLPNEAFYVSGVMFIAANGGYVYRLGGVGGAVTVLDAGLATVQNLTDIHALDSKHVVAVGASNAVVVSDDGENFSLVVGPAVGVALTAVLMLDELVWLVSTATALYSTTDGGVSWQQEGLPIAMTNITDIRSVGGVVYLSGVSGGGGVILRNTAGGTDEANAWQVLPEGVGTIPTNQRINKLAVCQDNHNLVYGAGLGATTDGFLVRAAP